jgi:HD-like signal output (HDOD) protein
MTPRARRRGRRGQTTTEYLMIAGIMTAIGILVLLWMFQPWRKTTQDIADCVREDDCEAVSAQ